MADPSDAVDELLSQLADEFAARQRAGERPSLEEYCARHPDLAGDIRELFPALVELERAKVDAGPDLAVAEAEAPPVTTLGDFRLLREVGRGGMGVVYEAEQVSLGRRVALKLLPAEVLRDPTKKRRFEREAKAVAKLHHTNIVPVHGFGEHDGTPYYVMQFIPGLGLDAVIDELGRLTPGGRAPDAERPPAGEPTALSVALARSLVGDETGTGGWKAAAGDALSATSDGGATPGPAPGPRPARGPSASINTSGVNLPGQSGSGVSGSSGKRATYWESVARIGVQVAGALAYAHKQGVLHRDIKPANLLLDLDGTVWVTDFGLAKADDSDDLTHTGDLLGTLRYMPPEAFEGRSDARGDVYSLGLTLYEMLAMRPAFDEKERNKLVKRVTTGEPTPLDQVRREVPRDLVTIVQKAIDREPPRRYATAEDLASDLQRFLDDEPVQARRQTHLERYVRWARHNPGIAVMGGVLAAVLVLATVASLLVAGHMTNLARNEAHAATYERLARQQAVRAQEREVEERERAERAQRTAEASRQQAEDALTKARKAEEDARAEGERADKEAEVAQQNLYFAQMHLGQQAWREHRGLGHMRELLANWLPKGESPDRRGWEWFYLNSLPYQNLRTITEGGRPNRPSTVAWHVASNRLAVGSNDGSIRIWDVDREQTTLTLSGPGSAGGTWWQSRWLGWSPDGGKLAAGFHDGTVHLWETDSGREIGVFRGHKSLIWSVAYSSDGTRLASWGIDGAIKIWDVNSGRLTADVAHPDGVRTGAWSPDDKLLASGHRDGTVTISGTQAGGKVVTLRGHVSHIHALAWSPDGTRLASTSYDHTARIWDVASETMALGPLRHGHEVVSVAWEPGGKRLATGSVDESVKIWNSATGREDLTLRGHRDNVASLAWGPGGRLASGGGDGSVRIWNSIRDQESTALPGHVVRATSVSWSPNGKRLASGGDDGKVRIWDPATREEVLAIQGHDEGRSSQQFGLIRSLAWSPDGTHLASGSLDGTAKVWDAVNGREIFALPADRGSVWSVAWSPDGTRLAAGSEDGTIRVVEALGQTPKVHSFKAHQGGVRALAWSPQGERLASGGKDKLVKLWDPIRGTERARMHGHQYWVMGVAWSPDGKRLASASGDRLVMAWNAETGQKFAAMRGHNDFVDAVVWSPDGTRLASASIDNSVRIWDPRTGEETFVLRGNTGMFHDVSWHPDGARLAAASSDGQVWVWDATRGFERDTTPRALPHVDRAVAAGTARGGDLRWYAESYARAGKLTEALALVKDHSQAQHRYIAARVAALAAAGQGLNGVPLDDGGKANLRRQALDWLRADLTFWGKLLESGPSQGRPTITETLSHWRQDPDLASIRDAAALAKLPVGEQKAFSQLWADVGAMDTMLGLKFSVAPTLIKSAALQAWFGQDQELAATCDQTLKFVMDTNDPTTAERAAKICSLRPSDDKTHEAALALARRAVERGTGHGYLVYFQLALGMAEYRSGHYAAADAALLAASKLGKNHYIVAVTAAFYRAMSLFQQGKEAEAQKLATEAVAKMKPLPDDEENPLASNASADDLILWMAFKEATALLNVTRTPRLLAVRRGEDQPADNAERLAFARIAHDHKKFAFAARFRAEALENDPRLADDRHAQHRYNAACAAALAAAGQGQDDPPADDAAKAKLRGQAMDWLRAELIVWDKLLASASPQNRPFIVRTLSHWQKDTDLAGIRDAAALAKLPAEEQTAFTRLWADVAALLKKTEVLPK